jgi:hypothetical protein
VKALRESVEWDGKEFHGREWIDYSLLGTTGDSKKA